MRHFLYKTLMVMCAIFILIGALPFYAHACCSSADSTTDSHLARQDCCSMESCSTGGTSCEIRAEHVDYAVITADNTRRFLSESLYPSSGAISDFLVIASDHFIPPAVPIGRSLHIQISSPLLL